MKVETNNKNYEKSRYFNKKRIKKNINNSHYLYIKFINDIYKFLVILKIKFIN